MHVGTVIHRVRVGKWMGSHRDVVVSILVTIWAGVGSMASMGRFPLSCLRRGPLGSRSAGTSPHIWNVNCTSSSVRSRGVCFS